MFFDQVLNGIQIGLTYVLIAVGYNLIFGVLKIVNLAYGEVFMVAAYTGLVVSLRVSANPVVVVLAALVGATLIGVLIHTIAVLPLGNVSTLDSPRHLSVIVSTMGISLVIQNTAVEIFGGYPQRFPRLVPDTRLGFGNFGVDLSLAFNLLIAGVVIATFYHVIKHTRLGLRMRALSDNLQLARSMGVSTTRDQYAAVVISSSLAGLAAIMVSQAIGLVSPFVGAYYGLKGLVAVLVGGLGRMGGAVVVALLLGLGEAFAASVASNYRDAITFGLMVVFILVRGAAASSEAS